MDDDGTPPARSWIDLAGEERRRAYEARWERLAAEGAPVHGEADLVDALLGPAPAGATPARVLDAGCGTGRVAVELARRGHRTVGVDRDVDLLAAGRDRAPHLEWIEADLVGVAAVVAPGSVDLAVLAGNVLLFTDPGTEGAVVAAVAGTLRPGGLLVAGFEVRPGGYGPGDLDGDAATAGLARRARWATWDRQAWTPGDRYQVSVHVRPADGAEHRPPPPL